MSNYVDWEFAKATARGLSSAGPKVSADRAVAEVAAIREAATRAHDPVAQTSQLQTPADAPAAVIVDRSTWVSANADSMSAMLEPTFAEVMAKRGRKPPTGTPIGARVAGAEAGALLAFMSSKVLGQYDLAPDAEPFLMLVAPNILHVQRELTVDPADFRLWVCMHEETHRVQFTAVPWLRQHLIDSARALASDMIPDPERASEMFGELTKKLPEVFSSGSTGIAELFMSPEQRAQVAQITAIMSLLEGHADVVMDDVGPVHIPSVAQIRSKFNERRKGAGTIDVLLRRLLGLEAKMRQYRDGAAFVRAVQDKVGVAGFNEVWTSPETLPKPAEIADPAAWVARVHS